MKITDIFPGLKNPDASPNSSNEKQQSFIGKVLDSLTDPQQYAVLSAEGRRGLKDFQNAVLNPWNGVTQTHEEPGTIGTPTQAEITAERGNVRGYERAPDDIASQNDQEHERGGRGR